MIRSGQVVHTNELSVRVLAQHMQKSQKEMR